MNIAFPYPSYWPYVRRGAERCIHDLATYLAGRGHDVHIITSTPGRARTGRDGDVRVTYLRQLSHPLVYAYEPALRASKFAVDATRVLIDERPDVVHLWSFSGITWAPLLREAIDLPYVQHIIMRNHYFKTRLDRFLFSQMVSRADRVVALTRGGAEAVTAEHGVACGVLPPPVNMDLFRPCRDRRTDRPIVLYPADLADVRKGGGLLLRAWNRVHRERPDAVLALAGPLGVAGYHQDHGAALLARLDLVTDPRARAAIEVRGPGDVDILPTWYSEASVTVLPSVEEAFGMVLTESLSCGTPVVASAYDGPGEIVTSPDVGSTIELREWSDLENAKLADDLAEAILHVIELSRDPATGERCRAHASAWGLERVGRQAEELLGSVAMERRHGRPRGELARTVA